MGLWPLTRTWKTEDCQFCRGMDFFRRLYLLKLAGLGGRAQNEIFLGSQDKITSLEAIQRRLWGFLFIVWERGSCLYMGMPLAKHILEPGKTDLPPTSSNTHAHTIITKNKNIPFLLCVCESYCLPLPTHSHNNHQKQRDFFVCGWSTAYPLPRGHHSKNVD